MKIAILGGSFDPPHLGHLFIASQVKEFLKMDQVWLMPAYQHPFLKPLTDTRHRFAMTKLLENEFLKVSDFEIQQNHSSYTIDTLNAQVKLHSHDVFYWVMGSDQLDSFQKFKEWKEIVEGHNLIIFPREAVLPQFTEKVKESLQMKSIPDNVIVLQNESLILTNISSTRIRECVKKQRSISLFVPEKVEEYILRNNLYR